MDKKKAMRITIDGYANTGKTLLAWKIAEFLKLHGVDGANITFFNDNVEQLTEDPIELERILNDATSRDMWKDMEVALVERTPPRLAKWAAKPDTYSPVLMSNDHINLEMGRNKRTLDPASRNAIKQALFDQQRSPLIRRELASHDARIELFHQVIAAGHAKLLEPFMFSDLEIIDRQRAGQLFDYWQSTRSPGNDTPVRLTILVSRFDKQPVNTDDMMALVQAFREVRPDVYLERKVQNASLSGALHPELTIADGEAAVSYSGTVLGHPVSIPARRLHSYGNYTPEELAKYKPQVHPTTGETREQMYERSAASREAKMNEEGQVGISFKDLPRDLVFDPKCGVRWYTEEELAKEGMRYPNALEFKHTGVRLMPNAMEPTTQPGAQVVRGGDGAVLMTWVPTPRGMSTPIFHLDDAGLWPDGKAPDPALEPRREVRDSALNQRLHEAARNLGNITELGISGRVELPKSED